MSKMIGRQVSVGIGKEISRGTAVAPDYWVPWMELDAETKVELINDESSLGVIEDADAANLVSKWGEGTIKAKMKDESMGLVFLSLFGTDTPSLVEAGVYDHLYSVGQTVQHQSLSIAKKDLNQDIVFPNCVIGDLKLDVELGSYIMYEVTFMGKQEETAANSVTNIVERDFVPQYFEFKTAANQAGLDAAPAVSVRNLSLEIKSNVAKDDVLGSITPDDINNQHFIVEGEITLRHNDNTYKALQNDETYQAFRFDITHPDTIGAASNPRLRIDLYKVRIFDYERDESQNELIEESFSFKAYFSVSDSKMLDVTLRNELAAY